MRYYHFYLLKYSFKSADNPKLVDSVVYIIYVWKTVKNYAIDFHPHLAFHFGSHYWNWWIFSSYYSFEKIEKKDLSDS